jgi:putative PIN family toxin of toxin-antitoxin system
VKIKAILDTNVLISGVFWKGPPFEILKAWQEQRFRLAISLPILDEYRRVLDEFAKERQMPVLNSVLKVIELRSEIVKPVPFSEPVCSDPDDDKFLEAAIAAGADYIVSGDKALLNVKFEYLKTRLGGLTPDFTDKDSGRLDAHD